MNPTRMRGMAAGLAADLFLLAGCATNPATGRPQLALISEPQEIEIGRDYDQRLQKLSGRSAARSPGSAAISRAVP